jgi:apolipoprotein N-acyltransferase
MDTLTALRIVTAGLIGYFAWGGIFWAIPLSVVVPCLTAVQPTRIAAAGTASAYYAAASAPVMAVARAYWPSLGMRAVMLWIAAAAILSFPSILCWTRREARRAWTTAAAVALSALPPLCIVGWASPLVSAGVLFPNAGWLGVLATLVLPGLLVSKHTRRAALFTAIAASLGCNLAAKPLGTPRGWEAETTSIHRRQPPDDLAEYAIERRLQNVATSSRGQFLVFPEGTVRRWTAATDEFWAGAIAGSGKTLFVGAGLPVDGARGYNNSTAILSETGRSAVHQRIPVPGGMWNPFRNDGFAMHLLAPGTADIGGGRAAVLICYEQLLVWPMLRSAVERPTLLIAASNEAWTAGTRVPVVQHACVRAWARLFGLPLISAINS